MRKTYLMFSLLVLGLMLSVSAGAVLLPPGVAVAGPGDPLAGIGSGPVVATTGVTPWANLTGSMHGLYVASVIKDMTRGGQLDFIIQFSNDASSVDAVGRLTTFNFTGFATDVGFDVCCAGSTAAIGVDRSLAGDTIGWQFKGFPGPPGVLPGGFSFVLEIQTDAYFFQHGGISFIDGGTTDVLGFAPAPGVPEPTSLVLFGSGLLGLGNIVRRKFFS